MRSDLETFSLKQRVFLVKNYYQYTGDYLCVKTKYEDNYKDSNEFPPFSYDILIEIINLFERTGSVLKATEGASGGTGQIIEQIYVRDFVKEEDPMALSRGVPIPSTSSAQSTKGDHLDDQEDSMMWDQSGFASDDDDSDNTPLARKHACDQCGVSFSSLEEWNGHQMKKHNIIPDISQSSKSASHKPNKNDPLKMKHAGHKKRKHLPYNLERPGKDQEQEASAFNPDCLKMGIIHNKSSRLHSTIKLDPAYDKIFNAITLKLDRLISMQKNEFEKNFTQGLDASTGNELNFQFPLSSKDELQQFNNNLKDDEFRMSVMKELSKINGYSGTNDGTKSAYKLIDFMFKRDLLIHYSWTGASRCGTKEAFNQFSHLLDMFWSVVRMADNSYAKVDAEHFFSHKILKHSTIRLQRSKENTENTLEDSSESMNV